jgi:ABC-type multidrug transport system ATPase subunit
MDLLTSELANTHLICDARHPLITPWRLADEALLYQINGRDLERLAHEFATLSGRRIAPQSRIGELSGGQKVMLMVLLALLSPARKIMFVDLGHSLDSSKQPLIRALIDRFRDGREIIHKDSLDED